MNAGIRAVREKAGWLLLAGLLALLPTGAARAIPVTYFFTGGSATVTATLGASTIGSASLPLTGTQVTFDTAPASLVSFSFDSAGPHVVPLTGIFTGTSITLSSIQIAPGVPYSSTVFGGPTSFTYTAGGIAVSSTVGLSGAINAGPFLFSDTFPALSGAVNLGTGTISLNGITLGVVSIPGFGNATVKADIVFTGIVPEPGTALLLGGGLAGLAAAGRRQQS